jgi:hypothetical protein
MKSTPEATIPMIHPRFRQSIPTLVEAASETTSDLRPIVERATSLVAEVRDYLRFEIDKVVVAIHKADWERQSDVAALKSRLDQLNIFADWIDRFDMAQPVATLGVIVDALEELQKEHPP